VQRTGYKNSKGLIYILNNTANWNGTQIHSKWNNTKFIPLAWKGKNNIDKPEDKRTDENGIGDFWAPPGGYAVYVPV
jgi:alpha-amylase